MHAPDLVIDAHVAEVDLHAAIAAACRTLLPGWAEAAESVEVGLLAGGISNALFVVSSGPRKVAFRIYGDNTENFVDRGRELELMQMVHDHGFGPQVLATFGNGRVEEFLSMRSLQPEEMAAPERVPTIAATLRRFHDIPPQGEKEGRTPFGRIYEWLDIAQQFTFEDPQKQQLFATFDFAALRAEVAQVERAAAVAHSPLVFSHNDLLSGNIMVPLDADPQSNGAVAAAAAAAAENNGGNCSGGSGVAERQRSVMTFIDFEYADWAPRGFDWGNHFCEYAGFECDYSRYPGQQAAELFIKHYLAAGADDGSAAAAADEADLRRCVAEANVYALAAHQYWGTWSLLQAKWSSIEFSYLDYAKLRWGEYFKRKDEFLAGAAAAFA